MNSIDAGANSISITTSLHTASIVDNGRGMETLEHIEQYFDTVGESHAMDDFGRSTDSRYGVFRIGRGQMFTYGYNTWRTRTFKMEVDLANRGLDYELEEDLSDYKGCSVSINFYNPLREYDLRYMNDGIIHAVKYSDVPIYLNGEVVSENPSTLEWDYEDENFYLKIHPNSTSGMEVYNQGMYVQTMASTRIGLSGILVSKQDMVLNMARNAVKEDTCPTWKAAKKVLKQQADVAVENKTDLTYGECESLLQKWGLERPWECSRSFRPLRDKKKLKLFEDVSGKHWSFNMINLTPARFQTLPDGRVPLCFSMRSNTKGGRLLDQKEALVLNKEILRYLKLDTPEDFLKLLHAAGLAVKKFAILSIEDLNAKMDTPAKTFSEKEYTPTEKLLIRGLKVLSQEVAYHFGITGWTDDSKRPRFVGIGEWEGANAFTDGATYVTFCRKYLNRQGNSYPAWILYGITMVHEYCHDTEDIETHKHSPEFYEAFEDKIDCLQHAVDKAYKSFMLGVRHHKSKLSQADLIEFDKVRDRIEAEKDSHALFELVACQTADSPS